MVRRRGRAASKLTLADGRVLPCGTPSARDDQAWSTNCPRWPDSAEGWGHNVIHCPYCHGWEARDRAIGVLGSGPMSLHQVQLFRQLSDDVTFFTHTMPPLTDERYEELAARDINVVSGVVAAWEPGGVRLTNNTLIPREVLAVAPAPPYAQTSSPHSA